MSWSMRVRFDLATPISPDAQIASGRAWLRLSKGSQAADVAVDWVRCFTTD